MGETSTSTTGTNTTSTATSATQAAATGAAPAQAATSSTTPDLQASDGKSAKTSDDYERMIADLRRENASHRTKLNKFEADEKARADAALSELERANKRATDSEAKIKAMQEKLVNAHVKLAAKDKGIVDPDLAALAVQSQLEYDDEGMPSNLDKVLADLVKQKPYLVQAAQAQASQTAAQTASSQNAPAIPAMNPGRTNIQSPTQQQSLQGQKRLSLAEAYRLNAQNNRQ